MYILLLLAALINYCLHFLGRAGLALVHFAAFKLTVFVNCKRKHTTNYFFLWRRMGNVSPGTLMGNSPGTVDFGNCRLSFCNFWLNVSVVGGHSMYNLC